MRQRKSSSTRASTTVEIQNEELAAVQLELESANAELQTLTRLAQRRDYGLHERSELLAGIVDAVSVPTMVIGPELVILQANPAFYGAFGADAATTLGRPLARVGQGEWRLPVLRRALLQAIERGQPCAGLEVELSGRGKEPARWVAASAQRVDALRLSNHAPVVVCCLEDITTRRRAALLLEAQIERLSATTIGLAIADNEQRISFANPALQALSGYPAGELVGANLHRRLHPRRRDGSVYRRDRCPIVAALRQHRSASGEEVIQRRDGSFRPVSWSVVPIGTPQTREGLVELRDLSREKQILQRLLDSEKMAATGQMAAMLAHEINNPLAVVNNALYLLHNAAGMSERERRLVSTADEELQRVNRIVRNTLGLYRAGESSEHSDSVLGIESALALHDRSIRRKRLHVVRRWSPRQGALPLALPPGDLRQILANLIGNAVDAAPAQGCISVAAHSVNSTSQVRILIGDDGPGILPEVRTPIFQPFFTTKRERGTGLGLWIVTELVRQHAGTIRMKSWTQPPTGTCFAVELPTSGV